MNNEETQLTQVAQPVSSAAVSPTPEPQKTIPAWVKILAGVFLILIVAGGAGAAFYGYNLSKSDKNPVPVSPTPTNLPVNGKANQENESKIPVQSDLQTYSNTQYGVNFQYPQGLVVQDRSAQFPPFALFISYSSQISNSSPYVLIQAIQTSLSPEQYIQDPNSNLTLKEEKMIGTQQYMVAQETHGMSGTPDYYLLKPGNFLLKISQSNNFNQTQFQEILSTMNGAQTSPTPVSGSNQTCGGFAGIKCPAGYTCKLEACPSGYQCADQAGTCVKN